MALKGIKLTIMRIFKYITALFFFAFFSVNLSAQSTDEVETDKKVVTTEFRVEGVCGMCKERIETAAMLPGVKFAEWNKETSILKVVYKTKKVKETDIHVALAKAGHTTSKMKATEEAYLALPGCCQYEEVEKH